MDDEMTRRRGQNFPHVLRHANSLKRADRRKMGPYLHQLNAFLDEIGLATLPVPSFYPCPLLWLMTDTITIIRKTRSC